MSNDTPAVPAPQRVFSLPEIMTYGSVRIECTMSNGKPSTGTGFTVFHKNDDGSIIPFFVTNKHVIGDCQSGFIVLSNTNKVQDTRIHTDQRRITFTADQWIPHPEKDIDLCVTPIAPLFRMLEKNNFYPFLDTPIWILFQVTNY